MDLFAAKWHNNDPTSGWQLTVLANPVGFEAHNADVQPNGAYHYHGAPMALLPTTTHPELIGFNCDGFPICGPYGYADATYPPSEAVELRGSCQLKSGERIGGPGGAYDGRYVEDYGYVADSGHLGECNAPTAVTSE